MRKQKYVISIQQNKGGDAPLCFEISEINAQKIIDLLNPDIKKGENKLLLQPRIYPGQGEINTSKVDHGTGVEDA